MGDQVQQVIAQREDRAREPAGELVQGGVELGGIRGLDDAQHGLGPRQVDAARQECAERELPWLGKPGPPGQAVAEDLSQERRRPDKVDLGKRLAGVSPRRRP